VLDVRCCRGDHQFSLGRAFDDFDEARAANADLDLALASAVGFDDKQAVADHGIGRHQDDIRLFAADDIDLNAHPHPQHGVVGQADPDPEGLRNGVAGRRYLLDHARQYLIGERIRAQQGALSDVNAGNILLIDFGDDP